MEGKFVVDFPIRYQDSDTALHATLTALAGIMQEAAILHSEAAGRGIKWLSARQLSWMLVQTRATIEKRPTFWNRVKVTTWPSEMGRLLSRREFVLVDEQDNLLLTATTLWAFMDTAKRKVTRVPPEVANAYQVFEERALSGPFSGPAAVKSPDWTARFPIRRWQIDFNGHVNNLRYLDWMLETVPDEIWENCQVRDLNIRYQKEAGNSGWVEARTGELDSGQEGLRRLAHEVLADQGQESVAVAETTWVPRVPTED